MGRILKWGKQTWRLELILLLNLSLKSFVRSSFKYLNFSKVNEIQIGWFSKAINYFIYEHIFKLWALFYANLNKKLSLLFYPIHLLMPQLFIISFPDESHDFATFSLVSIFTVWIRGQSGHKLKKFLLCIYSSKKSIL